jgi:hypothetical protein
LVVNSVAQTGEVTDGIGQATPIDTSYGQPCRFWVYVNKGSNAAKLQGSKTINAGTCTVVATDTIISAVFLG